MAYFNLTHLTQANIMIQARAPPGIGLDVHSDDCAFRANDRKGFCEPSTKRHECCTPYHFAAVMMLSDQPSLEPLGKARGGESGGETAGKKAGEEQGSLTWSGSHFFWQDRFLNVREIQTANSANTGAEVDANTTTGNGSNNNASSPSIPVHLENVYMSPAQSKAVHRIRVNNKCGRLVGFDSSDLNPHGVEPISVATVGGARTRRGGAGEVGGDNATPLAGGAVAGLEEDGGRWSLTMWFSTLAQHNRHPEWDPLEGEINRQNSEAAMVAGELAKRKGAREAGETGREGDGEEHTLRQSRKMPILHPSVSAMMDA